MKKRQFSGIIMVLILSIALMLNGCGGSKHNDLADYVKVTYDGTTYTFTSGPSAPLDGTAYGGFTTSGGRTYIIGTSSPVTTLHPFASGSGIIIRFSGDNYEIASADFILTGAELSIDTFTVSITKYEAVGGEITGTFSGTVLEDAESKPISGSFKVKRESDGVIDPFVLAD